MEHSIEPTRGFQGVWINASLWNDKKLTWLEKCLIAEIDSLSDEEQGPCYASSEYLAEKMRSTPGSIRNTLSELTKAGYLLQLGSDGRKTWRCVAPKYCVNAGKYDAWRCHPRCNPGVISDVTQRLHRESPTGDTEILDEILTKKTPPIVPLKGDGGVTSENGSKPKKEKLSIDQIVSNISIELFLRNNSVFMVKLRDWAEYKLRRFGAGATMRAFELDLANLSRYENPGAACDAIDFAIQACLRAIPRPKPKTPEQRKREKWGCI